jgi:hypothetical protein
MSNTNMPVIKKVKKSKVYQWILLIMVLKTNQIRARIDNAVAIYGFFSDYLKAINYKEDKPSQLSETFKMKNPILLLKHSQNQLMGLFTSKKKTLVSQVLDLITHWALGNCNIRYKSDKG